MEERNFKSTPRAGPSYAGESRLSASAESCRLYTGPTKIALCEEGAETARRKEGEEEREKEVAAATRGIRTDINDDQRQATRTPIVVLERLEGVTSEARADTPVPSPSKFFGTDEGTSDDYMSTDTGSCSHRKESDEERERRRRSFRKRRGSLSPEEAGKEGVRRLSAAKRGRGRPPTTGEYVGLAKAKQDLREAEERALEVEAERLVLESARRVSQLRSHRLSGSSTHSEMTITGDGEELTTARIGATIAASLKSITEVAQKSKNLKGTYVASLKIATNAIQEAFATLIGRTTTEETKALEAANTRLSRELDEMKREIQTLKCRMTDAQPQTAPSKGLDVEELLRRAVREAVSVSSARMDARLENIEARLLPEPRLRPPLAADKKREETAVPTTSAGQPNKQKKVERAPSPKPSVSTLMPPTNPGPATRVSKKGKHKKPSAAAVEAAAARRDAKSADASQHAPATPTWSEVVKGGKLAKKDEKKTPRRRRRGRGTLRVPKTAAVVLTLQPEAANQGVTYRDVLQKAKQQLDLAALDIPAVKYRQAVTGARMYEVSGAACKEKADALAGKLREIVGEDVVRISRPHKCAELRITGLDDSATAAEIAVAIARPGGCAADDVKVGGIKVDRRGCGTAWVKCPVEAAKAVTAPNTKVYVGWTVVRATLLPRRPMRCYQCHEMGHTGATCPNEDRTLLCFRCAQAGHLTTQCTNAPHCALCAAHDKPANHSVGSKGYPCGKPASKRRRGPRRNPPAPKAARPTAVAPDARAAPMET